MNKHAHKMTSKIYITALLISSCVKSKPAREPVIPAKKPEVPSAPVRAVENDPHPFERTPVEEPPKTPPKDDKQTADKKALPTLTDCDTSLKFSDEEPVFLPQTKVIVTRIMSPCQTETGKTGHRKNAGYMAMGFPCTGGEGRIDWKGTNYNRPKMVSFLLETSCPMSPTDKSKVQHEASQVLGFSKEAAFVALNPFMVQYWEIPGLGEADTGITVDLRSGKGLDEGWTSFIKPKPMRIFLVGRENAWVPGNFMYAVEGELVWASKNRFSLKVDKARVLKTSELEDVKKRCEALKPPRDCSKVF